MSDNQFRTLVLLERSLFGLRPQRLLSNNTMFFTTYLIRSRLLQWVRHILVKCVVSYISMVLMDPVVDPFCMVVHEW